MQTLGGQRRARRGGVRCGNMDGGQNEHDVRRANRRWRSEIRSPVHWQKLQRASRYINLTVTNARLSKAGEEKKGGWSQRIERARGQKAEQRGRSSLIKDVVEMA